MAYNNTNQSDLMMALPELVSDVETDSDIDLDIDSDFELNYDYATSMASPAERAQRASLMQLVLSVTTEKLQALDPAANPRGLVTFLRSLTTRARASYNQYLTNMVILQRLATNPAIADAIDDPRRLVLSAFVLGSTATTRVPINWDLWTAAAGLSRSEITADLLKLGHLFGTLQTVSSVSQDDLFRINHEFKAAVKKHVKVSVASYATYN